MMIATFTVRLQTCAWLRHRASASPPRQSNLEDLLLFVLEELVDLMDALVGQLLERFFGAMLVVAADVAVLLQLAEVVHDVPSHVADSDTPILGNAANHAHQFPSALLGQRGNRQAD